MGTQTEPAEILGHPQLKLEISVNQPLALVAARLCDVSPQGDSLLVSWDCSTSAITGAMKIRNH